MARRLSAKAREFDYSNVGKAGRRTGITLKEGKRDEYGMEEVDGMFSSPEKSPTKFTFDGGNETIIGSEGMSIDEGNGPGPETFLGQSSARRPSFFPPPIARSPMKSGLSGSPRRTPGLRSSPMPQSDAMSPSPSSGRQRLGRDPARSVRRPLNDRRPNTAPAPTGLQMKGKDKESTYVTDSAMDFSDADENYVTGITENLPIEQHTDDVALDPTDDDDLSGLREQDLPVADNLSFGEASPSVLASATRKSRSANQGTTNGDVPHSSQSMALELEALSVKRKRPGRPPKAEASKSQDENVQRPAKRPRGVESQPQDLSSTHPELNKFVEDYTSRTGPLKGRSLYILKRETPSDEAATHTRSGRVSVRPLAYWRNERCVYGDGDAENGERYPLATIKEIIRTEELRPQNRRSGQHKSSHKRSRKGRSRDAESGDEDDVKEPWEKKGVKHGYIRKWDPESQTSTSDLEDLDIAYAPSGMQTREVKDSTFRFAKLLSSSFLGSGIVELPKGGVKKPKNSKKMHMVFYVCHGRVQVDISGCRFSVGKGCVFQVPRGNYYSFANTYEHDARLFFTQGCIPSEAEQSADPADKSAAPEQEFAPEVTKPNATRGKPRGRPKAGTVKE